MKTAVLAILLVCLPAAAQITQVQSSATWTCSGTTCAPRVSVAAKDHLLVVWTFWESTGKFSASAADSFNNIFVSAVGPTYQSNTNPNPTIASQIFYVKQTNNFGPDTLTVSFSPVGTGSAMIPFAGVVVAEYMGADPNNPLDTASASYSSAQSGVLDSGTLILDSSNVLTFAGGIADQPVALNPGNGYASLQALTGGFGTGMVESTLAVGTNSTLQRATACIGANLPCPQAGATSANWLMQVAVFRASSSSTVAGGWNPVRPYQVADATQFPGNDPCAQTRTAIETPINTNQAPVVDSRGFISSSIPPCAAAPFLPSDQFQWFAPSGTLPMGLPLILGGRDDIYGTTIGYSPFDGTSFKAQNTAWCPGGSCTGGLGGVLQGTYSGSQTYFRGSTVTSGSTTYYALQTSNGQTPSSSPQYWSLASGFPSPVVEENMTTQNADVEANSLHNLSLDCEYASGTNTATDGCVGYLSSWGQENTILDRIEIRNATVAGIYLDNTGVADSGPFGPGVLAMTTPEPTPIMLPVRQTAPIHRRNKRQSPIFRYPVTPQPSLSPSRVAHFRFG